MVVIDVDNHFHEPMDWLDITDPELGDQLTPPVRFMDFMRSGTAAIMPLLAEGDRPQDPADLMPTSFRSLLERLDQLQPDSFEAGQDTSYFNADKRLEVLDELGIDVQFLNFTFASGGVMRALQAGRPDLVPSVQAAFNTFAAEQVEGHADRLIPVCRMHMEDVAWSGAKSSR
jgi:hypothetical protein